MVPARLDPRDLVNDFLLSRPPGFLHIVSLIAKEQGRQRKWDGKRETRCPKGPPMNPTRRLRAPCSGGRTPEFLPTPCGGPQRARTWQPASSLRIPPRRRGGARGMLWETSSPREVAWPQLAKTLPLAPAALRRAATFETRSALPPASGRRTRPRAAADQPDLGWAPRFRRSAPSSPSKLASCALTTRTTWWKAECLLEIRGTAIPLDRSVGLYSAGERLAVDGHERAIRVHLLG